MPGTPPGEPTGQGQGNPQTATPQGGQPPQGQNQAMQFIQMIQKGYQGLGQMIQAAGQNLPPEDIQMFQSAVKAADDLIQSLTGSGGQEKTTSPKPGGPMSANQSRGSRPSGPQY